MFKFLLPRRDPKTILALLILISMIFSPILIVGAGISWGIESQEIKKFDVCHARIDIVGDRFNEPTIVTFLFREQSVTRRLAQSSVPQGLRVGDQLEILFDGSSDPIPNSYIERHSLSTILGIIGSIQAAIIVIGRRIGRQCYGYKFDPFSIVAAANAEFQKQMGL